jgi:hypothetical protein
MSKRKTYGTIMMSAGVILGILLLIGSFFWMRDKSEMLLGVFVLVLYGMGQWLTTMYWQRIQEDWETTGETLARLQQAVTDIPAALDSNLKAIATRLSENQQKALSLLQGEVNEGARQVLEKGVGLIGESLEKNLRSPLADLQSALAAWQKGSQGQIESLQTSQREGAAQAKALAELVAGRIESLAKAMTGEVKSLAGAMTDEIKTLTGSVVAENKALNETVVGETKSLAASMAGEAKALAAATARAGEESRAAWASEAKRVLDGWEARVQGFEQRVLAELGREAGRLSDALSGSAGAFEAGLSKLREASQQLIGDVEARAAEGQSALVERLSEAQAKAMGEAGRNLEAQGRLGLELAEKVADLAERMAQGSKDFQELASLSRINQAEMQAGVGMLNTGLASILDRLDKQASTGEGYQDFLADMGKALAAFQERAGEALMENAMKTQEILMEVLNQAERKSAETSIS